jgi:hypothetical protein
MAHALETFFDFPAQAAPARRSARPSLARRLVATIEAHQMRRVERVLRSQGYVLETARVHGDLRRVGLSRSDALPFNR